MLDSPMMLRELIATGAVPAWARPVAPDPFFSLVERRDLSDDEVELLISAAGHLSEAACETQWRAFNRELERRQPCVPPAESGDDFAATWAERCPSHLGLSQDEFDHLYKTVWLVLFHRVRQQEVASDLAQETFLRIHRKRSDFDSGRGSVGGWAVRIAKNIAIDWFREERRLRSIREQLGQLVLDEACDGATNAEHNGQDTREVSLTLLDQRHFPPAERHALTAKIGSPRAPHTELANALGVSPGAFEAALCRARKRLEGYAENAGH